MIFSGSGGRKNGDTNNSMMTKKLCDFLLSIFLDSKKKLLYEVLFIDGYPCVIFLIYVGFDMNSVFQILCSFLVLFCLKYFLNFSELCIYPRFANIGKNIDDYNSSSTGMNNSGTYGNSKITDSSSIRVRTTLGGNSGRNSRNSGRNSNTNTSSNSDPKHKNAYINFLCMNQNFLIFSLYVCIKFLLSMPYFLYRSETYFHSWYFLLFVNIYYVSYEIVNNIQFVYLNVLLEYVYYVAICVMNILHLIGFGFTNGLEFTFSICTFVMLYVLWVKLVFKVLNGCENQKLA
jgi:hypothetical protein